MLLLACAVAGCGGARAAGGRERVVASFYPLAFAAQAIGGTAVDVQNLTPPGAEPHDLEVTPGDVQDLKAARLVLLMGHGFQPQLEDAAGSGSRVLRLLDTPGLGRSPDGDPHVWLDPLRYALIVKRIGAALGRPAPAALLVVRLKRLDGAYRRGLGHCARRTIVTSHAAFGYLASRYGLRQVAVTGLVPDTEPTPGALVQAIDAVRASGATTVFTEPLVSTRVADTVARETGKARATLDPLEGQPAHGDYFTVMRTNLGEIRKALGCR
jgi:zinc transport system substrate-binding protein